MEDRMSGSNVTAAMLDESAAGMGGSRKKPRLWLVGLTAIVGLAAIIVAGNPGWFGQKSWPLTSVVPSVLVNLGTALIIAALLVFLEPAFTKRVRLIVEGATNAAEERVMQQVTNLQQHVDTLTERTAEELRNRDAQTDRALVTLTESPSFEGVTRVLEQANDLNALADGIATVQGGTDPPDDKEPDLDNPLSVRVRFLWGTRPGEPEPSLLVQAVCEQSEYLFASLKLDESRADSNDYLCSEIPWNSTDTAEHIGVQLITDLRSKNLYRGAETLDWGKTLSELARTIAVAVATRRGGESRWPRSTLFELVGNDWAITKMGLEYKGKKEFGPVFYSDDFPTMFPSGRDYESGAESIPRLPSPDGPQPSERVLIRAAAYLPLRPSPNTPEGWRPQRSGT
jgi:hypothetical protein